MPLGVFAAIRPKSVFDNIVMTVSLFGVSMPIFWLGLMLILIFGGTLGWLPIGGLLPIGAEVPRITGMSVLDTVLSGRWGPPHLRAEQESRAMGKARWAPAGSPAGGRLPRGRSCPSWSDFGGSGSGVRASSKRGGRRWRVHHHSVIAGA